MPLSQKRILKQFKYSMYFNGAGNYVRINGNPTVVAPFTVSVWASVLDNGLRGFIGTRAPNEFSFDAKLYYGNRIHGDIGNGTTWMTTSADVLFNYSLSTWYNIGYVVTQSGYAIYINGNATATNSFPANNPIFSDANHVIAIGAASVRGLEPFYGFIAQALIYSRALSDSEIQYNYQNPDNPITNGLVLWLQADPKYVKSNTWIDLSGYGNNGTIYGAQLMQLEKTPARILNAKRVLGAVR